MPLILSLVSLTDSIPCPLGSGSGQSSFLRPAPNVPHNFSNAHEYKVRQAGAGPY